MMTRHVEIETEGFVSCLLDSCPYGTPLSITFSFFFCGLISRMPVLLFVTFHFKVVDSFFLPPSQI